MNYHQKTLDLTVQNLSCFFYPGGMPMPGRVLNSPEYRFGYNGMEKDDEVKGQGNSLDYGARILDPRLNRWLSVDPLANKYPSLSPYNYVANNPTIYRDIDGRDFELYIDVKNKKIIVCATVYSINNGVDNVSARAAAKYWNNQTGKFKYTFLNSKNIKEEFKIEFHVGVVPVKDIEQAQISGFDDPSGNTYYLDSDEFYDKEFKSDEEKGIKVFGFTTRGNQTSVRMSSAGTVSGSHEMGHTLGLGHFNYGLMLDDNKFRINDVTKSMVNQILKIGFGDKDFADPDQLEPIKEGNEPNQNARKTSFFSDNPDKNFMKGKVE